MGFDEGRVAECRFEAGGGVPYCYVAGREGEMADGEADRQHVIRL